MSQCKGGTVPVDCFSVLQTGYLPQLMPDGGNALGAAYSKIDGYGAPAAHT